MRWQRSGSTRPSCAFLGRARSSTTPTLRLAGDYRFSGDIWGYAEGDATSPARRCWSSRARSPRRCCSRRSRCRSSTTTARSPSAASRMMTRRRRPAADRDGLAPDARASRGRRRACGVRRGLRRPRRTSTPGQRLRHPHARHQRTRVHAAARHRARRVQRAGRVPRHRHHAAGRHLRRPRRQSRTAVEVAGPELGAVRLDSGDLADLAPEAREQLDALGASGTRIVVTGDLDEYAIAALASARPTPTASARRS